MKIVFLKNHTNYKAGDVIEKHTNAKYLIACGVAKEVVEVVKPIKKNGKL